MIIIVQWITVLQFISHLFYFVSYSEIEEKYLDPKKIIIVLIPLSD